MRSSCLNTLAVASPAHKASSLSTIFNFQLHPRLRRKPTQTASSRTARSWYSQSPSHNIIPSPSFALRPFVMSSSKAHSHTEPREAPPVYRCDNNHWHFHPNKYDHSIDYLPWYLWRKVSLSPISFRSQLSDCNQRRTETIVTATRRKEVRLWSRPNLCTRLRG